MLELKVREIELSELLEWGVGSDQAVGLFMMVPWGKAFQQEDCMKSELEKSANYNMQHESFKNVKNMWNGNRRD